MAPANLNVLVGELRQALHDDAKEPRFVRTVFGFGYAFAAEATGESAAGAATVTVQPRVLWERRVIPLLEGENVIGRDEGVAVRIDAPGVSRNHARLLVSRGQATLEDLGSKNGTYLNDQRLDVPTPLPDGAAFRLGRLVLLYRSGPETGSTVTEDATVRHTRTP